MTSKTPIGKYVLRTTFAVLTVLGISYLIAVYSRDDGVMRPRPVGGAAAEATQAAGQSEAMGGNPSGPKIVGYRSTMLPEVSQTPRKDSMGMDMVPVYEVTGSMLELSEDRKSVV